MQSVNPNVLSVPQFMQMGLRILVSALGFSVFIQPHIQVAPSFDAPKLPVSAIRVRVSSADRSTSVIVNALFSVAVQTSSISELLAVRLGIEKGESIVATGFTPGNFSASLPSRHVDVECMDVVSTIGKTVVPNSTFTPF